MARSGLGRRFAWLWASYAVSTLGSRLAFDALPLVAILALHAGPARVSALAAAGLAVGAVLAAPLGAWVEFRPKRRVMIAMDLARCALLVSVPVAFAMGRLTFTQLLVVAVAVAAGGIVSTAASGALVKELVRGEDLVAANARLESTSWTATALGPPLGGAAIGVLGPVATVLANAAGYLLSAAGLRAMGGGDPAPARSPEPRAGFGALLAGWRHIVTHPTLRPLFVNTVAVNALILAPAPLLAVLMLAELGFAPWQYGLAFAAPCLGGLLGARLADPLAARFGRHRVLLAAGALRACWPIGLAFIPPGAGGLAMVIGIELGVITSVGVFNPLLAAYRLEELAPDRVTRSLTAWSVTGKLAAAGATGAWGLLAGLTTTRTAILLAGALLLLTPLVLLRLPRHPPRPRRP